MVEDETPEAERVAPDGSQEFPQAGIDAPDTAFCAVLSGAFPFYHGCHQANDIVLVGGLCKAYIAVSHKSDCAGGFIHGYDSVQHIAASCVQDQDYRSYHYFLRLERREHYLIFHIPYERVHTSAFCSDGDTVALKDQSSDFLQQYIVSYCQSFSHKTKVRINSYLCTNWNIIIMYKYKVAEHCFGVILPEGFAEEEHLSPYLPFATDCPDTELIFVNELVTLDRLKKIDAGKVLDCLNDEAPYFWMLDNGGKEGYPYNFGFSYSKSHPDCIVMPSSDFRYIRTYVPENYASKMAGFALSNSMMLAYAVNTMALDTLLIHASTIRKDGKGYVFLGKSGTGKSTHSRLWLDNIEGSVLLNDDNPILRITDGIVTVYGSPWSGKTPCYRNESVPLQAVVRLSQAPFNRIRALRPVEAYAALSPSCSCIRWDNNATNCLHSNVEKVVRSVKSWHLECLPDADAANVCFEAVSD